MRLRKTPCRHWATRHVASMQARAPMTTQRCWVLLPKLPSCSRSGLWLLCCAHMVLLPSLGLFTLTLLHWLFSLVWLLKSRHAPWSSLLIDIISLGHFHVSVQNNPQSHFVLPHFQLNIPQTSEIPALLSGWRAPEPHSMTQAPGPGPSHCFVSQTLDVTTSSAAPMLSIRELVKTTSPIVSLNA